LYKEATTDNTFGSAFGQAVKEHSNWWKYCISENHAHLNDEPTYQCISDLLQNCLSWKTYSPVITLLLI